jgi:ferredoxin-type protein NapH
MRKIKPSIIQGATALLVLALACVGLATNLGTGTYSAFGIGEFFLLCPLGGFEVLLASKTFIPQAIISLIVVCVLALLFGRSWCAWACPTRLIRRATATKEKKLERTPCSGTLLETIKSDPRLWVLALVLVVTLVIGFPVFCLVCPIGLTFGTVTSIWHAIQFNDVSWGLLAFPAALVIELIALKRWCIQICPIAGLLTLFGRAARVFRPTVDAKTCLKENGQACHACKEVCPESIDLHAVDTKGQLADCTRCAECLHVCPTASITMPVLSNGGVKNAGEAGAHEPAASEASETGEAKTEE